jgi:hypothetical protein
MTKPRLLLIASTVVALALSVGSSVMGQSQAPTDPMAPTHWTGTWTGLSNEGATETEGPGYTDVLVTTNGMVEATDPRIVGPWVQNHHIRTYHGPEGDVSVASATARIDNEDGSWVGSFTGYYTDSSGEEWNIFVGEGAYEGLTAVFRYQADNSLDGVIVPGEVPPMPDPVPPPAE